MTLRPGRGPLCSAVVALAVGMTSEAWGYSAAATGRSIFVSRWLVCHDEDEPAPPPPRPPLPPAEGAPFTLVPVPRGAKAPSLTVVPHPPDDVAFTEPLPADAAPPRLDRPTEPPPGPVVLRESRNDYRCLGYVRGKAGIVRVIDAPPGTRFYRHEWREEDWVQENMVAAAALHVTEAIPALRKALARPHPLRIERGEDFARVRTVALAANALAELGDHASSPRIRELLVELESIDFAMVWQDTFRALARNDRAAAASYALEVVEKLAAKKLPEDRIHEYADVLQYLDPADRERALPPLVGLTTNTALGRLEQHELAACKIYGARLRMGDATFAREVRGPLAGTTDTNLAAHCYRELVTALYPGHDIDELPVLVHRRRHLELLELTRRLQSDTSRGATAKRANVLAALRGMGKDHPERWHETARAPWLAARAGLGDLSAREELYRWVDDPTSNSDGRWMAAWAAVRLRLPGALDHARIRLIIGVTQAPHTVRDADLGRGGTTVTWPVRLIDALVEAESPLFALGLLSRDHTARERALFALSRHREANVCGLLASALRLANDDVVDEALWGLTTLGSACSAEIESLAREPSAPSHLRSMALEHLAMVKSPAALPLANAWDPGAKAHAEKASLARVRLIVRSPE